MDPRVQVGDFGPAFDGAFVLRNAGARATHDVVRSLIVAWRVLGVHEVVVVHHTDCRMMAVTERELRDDIAAVVGPDAEEMDFFTFTDAHTSLEEDVHQLERSRYLAGHLPVSGFIWDLDARELEAVVIDPRSQLAPADRPTGDRASSPDGSAARLR